MYTTHVVRAYDDMLQSSLTDARRHGSNGTPGGRGQSSVSIHTPTEGAVTLSGGKAAINKTVR